MTATHERPPTLRVAHVIQNLNFGGMERILHTLARELPKEGIEVHIVVLDYFGHFANGLEQSAGLHRVPRMGWSSFAYPRHLIDILRGIAPHIVHSHAGVWFKAARASRLSGVRCVVHTDHGRPHPVPVVDRVVDNIASRWTDVVVAVSDALADTLTTSVVHKSTRIQVIRNGVDTTRAIPAASRAMVLRDIGIPEHSWIIGTVGRLEPVKNYALAIRAFARLLANSSDADPPGYLVIAGDGSERESLTGLAEATGISHRVRFLGWQGDVERIYACMDLFTLTSLSEGTSVSLLEAMSVGVCPVVTDVGGNAAVLGAELDDLLVPSGGESALAAAWHRFLSNPRLREERALRARVRVEAAFSLRSMIRQHAALYRDLMQAS